MERTLVSIQVIKDIQPIPEALAIEVAAIQGWQVVVKKGQFQVGDLVALCEIDSILPFAPWSEFLRDKHRPEKPIRIKTIRLRGQISQGICFPLSILPYRDISNSYVEGQDVTDLLGITKYEPPEEGARLGGNIKGNFPPFLHKMDEIRVQSVPSVLERHNGKTFYVSEKLDGASITLFLKGDRFGVCSRNLELTETEGNAFWELARKGGWEDKLRVVSAALGVSNVAVQGELVGVGVQKNKYKLPERDIFLYNIYDIDNAQYVNFNTFREVCASLGIKTVPIVDYNFLLKDMTVEMLLEYSKGNSALNPHTVREGVVFRPLVEERDYKLGRLSFKAVNNDFLLKYGE